MLISNKSASNIPLLLSQNKNVKYKIIKLYPIGWRRFLNGISIRYNDNYPVELYNIIPESDFNRIFNSMHNRILSYWPCDTCFIFGIACAPFTLGTSLLCPGKCAILAEKEAIKFLRDVSLNKNFYERSISFDLKKNFFTSWIEISFPFDLIKDISLLEEDNKGKGKLK